MTYEARRQDFSREHFYIVELELDFCTRSYGVNPCTASIPGTGSTECYNTRVTCQDPANYNNNTGKIHRYCTARSELPAGLDAIPSIIGDPQVSPTKVEVDGGLGVRAQVTINFTDHPDNDLSNDPYVLVRTGGPATEGTHWGRLRARNPFHINRRMRVYSGYLVDGVFDWANFEERLYLIEDITLKRGRATVKGKDPLKRASSNRAEYPVKNNGVLAADLPAGAASVTLSPPGIVAAEYPLSGYIRIGEEVIRYGVLAGDTLNLFDRGDFNTEDADHTQGDLVQVCWRFTGKIDVAVAILLGPGAGIPFDLQDLDGWAAERENYFNYDIDGIVTEPTKVDDLLKELSEAGPHYLFWDERAQLVRMVAIKPPPDNAFVYNESDHIIADSLSVREMPDMRISRVQFNYGLFDPTQSLDEFSNYRVSYNRVNTEREGPNQYDQPQFKVINSRWLTVAGETAAKNIAATLGRRFGLIPRMIKWQMDPKDGAVWTGDTVIINSRETPNFDGSPGNTPVQIISAKEIRGRFEYEGLEYRFDDSLVIDPDPNTQTIQISGRVEDFNFRTAWENRYGTPTAASRPRLEITPSGEVGTMDTGSWPAGMAPILVRIFPGGRLQGRGGNGALGPIVPGGNGSAALRMLHAVIFEPMDGIIAGGGGGGGAGGAILNNQSSGGGGAGIPGGSGGGFAGNQGGIDIGGEGNRNQTGSSTGGDGGNRGLPGNAATGSGATAGGANGPGIRTFGFALTWQRAPDAGKVEGGIV
jgi:hypothetical protein